MLWSFATAMVVEMRVLDVRGAKGALEWDSGNAIGTAYGVGSGES